MEEKKDREACEELKKRSKMLETRLSDFLLDNEILEIQAWVFEYSDQLAQRLKIESTDPRFDYIHTLNRYDIFRTIYSQCVKELVGMPQLNSVAVTIPTYEQIPGIINRFLRRRK